MNNSHAIPVEQLIESLNTNIKLGLASAVATAHQEKFGLNSLSKKKNISIWKLIINQFLDPVIYILGGAFIISIIFGEILEGFAILIVILITVLIGFFMEYKAKKSVEALQNLVHTYAVVIRDGISTKIESQFVVPGDLIVLEAGDVVPADARITESQSMALKEAVLTGESAQTEKRLDILTSKTPISDQVNMVFKGTIVSRGQGKAIVTNIGDQTAIGQINLLTQKAEKSITPLEHKLLALSRWLIWLTLIITVIIAITGFLQGKNLLLMIKTAIALAVAAIPEGLPVVATITLARGMLKLSRQNVIIKKLEAVETLGSTTIICTDKTGTLTENKMQVHKIAFQNDHSVTTEELMKPTGLDAFKKELAFQKLIDVGILCNTITSEATLEKGDSVEVAMLNFAALTGYDIWRIKRDHQEIMILPFDTEKKMMATVNRDTNTFIVHVKGAPENVIQYCDYQLFGESVTDLNDKDEINSTAQNLAKDGLRVLSAAYKEVTTEPGEDDLLEGLVHIGLIGFLDPPRMDIPAAIKTYKNAGIKVVMITGDHPETAKKIGEEIGLIEENTNDDLVVFGPSLAELLTENEDQNALLKASIFSRMLPKQKLDLVEYYQNHDEIVGMIGDGVNDAPALKKADIGIAMGIRGTEAAKEAADVILMDDKFTSTELAIRQGRTIFENIRHFVVFLLSCNLAEIISVAIAAVTILPLPLLPLQILYLNLITDIFPALALGMGKGDREIMRRAPRDANENIMTRKLWIATVGYGLVITGAVLAISFYGYVIKGYQGIQVNNMAFYTLVLAQLLNLFNLPHRRLSFLRNEVISNVWVWAAIFFSLGLVAFAFHIPLLKEALNLVILNLEQGITIIAFAFTALILTQILKRVGIII